MNADDSAWRLLDGADPQTTFPAPARLEDEPIWIFRTETGFFAVQEKCPHQDRDLDTAKIVGGGKMIRCGHHNYTFRLADGSGVNFPNAQIAVYDIKEEDGKLFGRKRT